MVVRLEAQIKAQIKYNCEHECSRWSGTEFVVRGMMRGQKLRFNSNVQTMWL